MKQLATSAAARHGWTFVVAIGLLAFIAVLQFVAALWRLIPASLVTVTAPQPPIQAPVAVPQPPPPFPSQAATALAAQPSSPAQPPVHQDKEPATSPDPEQTRQAFALIEQAERAARIGDWPAVLSAATQAQEILGPDPQLQLQQAFALGRLEREQEALALLQRLMARPALDPSLRDQAVQLHEFLSTTISNMDALAIPRQPSSLAEDLGASPGPIVDAVGLQPGASLGIVDVREVSNENGRVLRIAIKARPGTPIETKDVKVMVSFYEKLPDGSIQPSATPASAEWISKPVNWDDNEPEILDISYSQPTGNPRATNSLYGYIVALYLRDELQDTRSVPGSLEQQFPPALLLEHP